MCNCYDSIIDYTLHTANYNKLQNDDFLFAAPARFRHRSQ